MANTTIARNPGVFRQHASVGVPPASALLRQLCEEWTALHSSDHARATISTWSADGSFPVQVHSPGALVDLIDAASGQATDDILRALLALMQDGERLAGRILLQSMLPCLSELPRSCTAPRGETTYEESLQRVVAEFWAVIAKPRTLTHSNVAGRLRMDTLHGVTSHRRSADAWEDHTDLTDAGDGQDLDTSPALHDSTLIEDVAIEADTFADLEPDATLKEVLVVAYRTRTLNLEETRFLGEVYFGGDLS